MQPTPEEKLTLACIKIHPSTVELEQLDAFIPQIGDWEKLISNIIERGIGPLFYTKLSLLSNSHLIPASQQTKLQQSYFRTISRSTVLYDYFRKVMEAFTARNIDVIALKGIYLSEWLYQDIGLRQFSDIDLLVKEPDGEKCLEILNSLEFVPVKVKVDTFETDFVKANKRIEIIHYPPMIKEGVSIEIHIKLHSDTEQYHLDTAALINNAIPVSTDGISAYSLGKYDQLIHLCVHLDKHFKVGHVQFTCFMDIVNYMEKYANDFDWEILIATCREYHCEKEVFRYIVLCYKYMNAALPRAMLIKYEYLLTPEIEASFFGYLNGAKQLNEHHGKYVPGHLRNVRQLNSFSDKLRYVRDVVFPPKAFIMQKYGLNRSSVNSHQSTQSGVGRNELGVGSGEAGVCLVLK